MTYESVSLSSAKNIQYLVGFFDSYTYSSKSSFVLSFQAGGNCVLEFSLDGEAGIINLKGDSAFESSSNTVRSETLTTTNL